MGNPIKENQIERKIHEDSSSRGMRNVREADEPYIDPTHISTKHK